MIIQTQLKTDRKGNITAPASAYDPSMEVKELTQKVMTDFDRSYQILTKPYREFNNKSLIEKQRDSQKSFNSYVEPPSQDPDEAWKSNAFRPIVRNRVISIAAHITGSLIYPQIQAQNEYDQEDKDAAMVMRDLVEWVADQAGYEKTFLNAVIAALVNPGVIIHTQYAETHRTVKEIAEDGSWKSKDVLDELYSGFMSQLVPLDELLIADIYEADIQKQPYLIWRRVIDFTVAETKYGDNANFKSYVRPGLQVKFNQANDGFYEQYDEELQDRLVEEVVYYNRSKDIEIAFCNGVLVTDKDQPNRRKDKRYPFAKTGYEVIDEGRFFYYKSLVDKLGPDEAVINILYRMIIDGTFLQLMPPTAVFGDETVTSSVVAPGTVTVFESSETKLQKIDVGNNLTAGLNTLEKVEASVSETSTDPLQNGQSGSGNQTAFEISRMEQNARIVLGLFGKMIGFLVKDWGDLWVSDILQYMTVGEVMQLTNSGERLKFRSFLLEDKNVNGKKKSRSIRFDQNLPDKPLSDDEMLDASFQVMDQETDDTEIVLVNPTVFRNRKFKTKVTPDTVTPPSDNVKKALMLEEYDRAMANPLADQEAVYRDLLLGAYDATKHDTDKYIKKPDMASSLGMPMGQDPSQGGMGGMVSKLASPGAAGTPSDLASKVA